MAKQAARKSPTAPRATAGSRADSNPVLAQLDVLTVPALRAVAEKAHALIKEKADSERKALVDDVTAKAKELGISLKDLFGFSEKAPRKTAAKRSALPVKYRGPNPQDQWSGRGRPPKWLQALEAGGREREEFLV